MSLTRIPKEYIEEYNRERTPFVRSRVALYFLVTTGLYFSVTLFYAVRQIWTSFKVFDTAELPVLANLIVATVALYFLNRRSRSIRYSKICAYTYTWVFLYAITSYGFYKDHAFLFVFYYGSALLLVALIIPWALREIVALALAYTAAFSLYLGILNFGMHYPIHSFPRFHPYLDGLVFMGIASAVSFVVRRMDNRHDVANFILLKRIEKQNRQIEGELELAERVHRTLIPESVTEAGVDIAVTYVPMSYLGGDCAKFRFLEDDRVVVFISDVTGHGVSAALLVNRVHAEFERLVREDPSPGKLLKNLNRFISRDFDGTAMYLSAFCGLIDLRKMKFSYSNYGHPAQYLYRISDNKITGMESHTSLLGMFFSETEHFEGEVPFKRGDNLLLFTDGVLETMNARRELYGEERLMEFIRRNP